jgi:hypothetical protein
VFIDFEDGERMVRVTAGLRERGYLRAAGTVEAALRRPHPEKTMEAVRVLQSLPAEAVDGLPLVPTNGANARK